MILDFDDGVNDWEAFNFAWKKLEAEGFFDEVKRKYGGKPSVVSSSKSNSVASKNSGSEDSHG